MNTEILKNATPPAAPKAAAYVRMSRAHPAKTAAKQLAIIRRYARRGGMKITATYQDGLKRSAKPHSSGAKV